MTGTMVETKSVGNGYEIRRYLNPDKAVIMGAQLGLDSYDIVLFGTGDREICKMSTGCAGEKSSIYWMGTAVQFIKQIIYIDKLRCIAYDKLMDASTDITMSAPKDGHKEEWDQAGEEVLFLENWMLTASAYHGENDDRTKAIRREWEISKMFCK